MKLTYDGGDTGYKKYKQAMVAPMVGFGGSLEPGGGVCFRTFGRNVASVA
jgi:hypothetical protein